MLPVANLPRPSMDETSSVDIGGGVLAVAAVVRDTRVSLKGRACAAGCLKLYMARTPQELIAAGVVTDSAAFPGAVPGTAPVPASQAIALGAGPDQAAAASASAQGVPQAAASMNSTPGMIPSLGATAGGLSATSPALASAPARQKKARPPVGKAGAKKGASAETVSFALGWFADSGEDNGEERLWLEEQMMVADGVKEKVQEALPVLHYMLLASRHSQPVIHQAALPRSLSIKLLALDDYT